MQKETPVLSDGVIQYWGHAYSVGAFVYIEVDQQKKQKPEIVAPVSSCFDVRGAEKMICY
jgi:hypothetical protein